jgi:GAF domain-containing protein
MLFYAHPYFCTVWFLVSFCGFPAGMRLYERFKTSVYTTGSMKARIAAPYWAISGPWGQHWRDAAPAQWQIGVQAVNDGEFEYSGYCVWHAAAMRWYSGEPLHQLTRGLAEMQRVATRHGRSNQVMFAAYTSQLVQFLLGQRKFEDSFDVNGQQRTTEQLIQQMLDAGVQLFAHFLLTYQQQARFYAGDYAAACSFIPRLAATRRTVAGHIYFAMDLWYSALSHLRHVPVPAVLSAALRRRIEAIDGDDDNGGADGSEEVDPVGQAEVVAAQVAARAAIEEGAADVSFALRRCKTWAVHGPMNFQHRVHLLSAERLRVQCMASLRVDLVASALSHYRRAVTLARSHSYINEEALAMEMEGRFLLEIGRVEEAALTLRQAYRAYKQWQCVIKVAQLRKEFGSNDALRMASLSVMLAPSIDPATGSPYDERGTTSSRKNGTALHLRTSTPPLLAADDLFGVLEGGSSGGSSVHHTSPSLSMHSTPNTPLSPASKDDHSAASDAHVPSTATAALPPRPQRPHSPTPSNVRNHRGGFHANAASSASLKASSSHGSKGGAGLSSPLSSRGGSRPVDLDLLTVLRFAQSFTLEVDPQLLLQRIMESVLQAACATRAVLLLRAHDSGAEVSAPPVVTTLPSDGGMASDSSNTNRTTNSALSGDGDLVSTTSSLGGSGSGSIGGSNVNGTVDDEQWSIELTAEVCEEGTAETSKSRTAESRKHASHMPQHPQHQSPPPIAAVAAMRRADSAPPSPLGAMIPLRVFHYVLNSQESLSLSDPTRLSADSPFTVLAMDEYFRGPTVPTASPPLSSASPSSAAASANTPPTRRPPRALLCLPIFKLAGQIQGVLYLESSSNAHAFAAAPIFLLQLLCSQAALHLSNSRLYTRLAHSHASLEALVRARTVELQQRNRQLENEIQAKSEAQTLMLQAKNEAEQAAKSKADFLSNSALARCLARTCGAIWGKRLCMICC